MTDEEKLELCNVRSKLKWLSTLCVVFEIACLISVLAWVCNLIFNESPYTLTVGVTSLIVIYLLLLPAIQSSIRYGKWTEYINIPFMLLGAYLIVDLTRSSQTEFLPINITLFIIYTWCVIACESYRHFNITYTKWKWLDELLSLEILSKNLIRINSEIFKLNNKDNTDTTDTTDIKEIQADEAQLKIYTDYKEFAEKQIKYLKNKHGI